MQCIVADGPETHARIRANQGLLQFPFGFGHAQRGEHALQTHRKHSGQNRIENTIEHEYFP